jgi:hypothetical protein
VRALSSLINPKYHLLGHFGIRSCIELYSWRMSVAESFSDSGPCNLEREPYSLNNPKKFDTKYFFKMNIY